MRKLNDDEQKLMDILKDMEGVTSSDELASMMGWTKQMFLDVSCPVARDFKNFNLNNAWKLSLMLACKDVDVKVDYFSQPLVNCALLLESKLVELNTRKEFNDTKHQIFIGEWKKYRGY